MAKLSYCESDNCSAGQKNCLMFGQISYGKTEFSQTFRNKSHLLKMSMAKLPTETFSAMKLPKERLPAMKHPAVGSETELVN